MTATNRENLMKNTAFKAVTPVIIFFSFSMMMFGATWSSVSGQDCQILDNPVNPVYEIGLGYVSAEQFGSYEDSGILEFSFNWDAAYFRDLYGAEVDTGVTAEGLIFEDYAGIYLPDQLLALALDVAGTWRYENGLAFQARLRPGMYSDLESMEGGVFYMPFSGAFIQSFSPVMSGIAGLEIRPGFEQIVMPLIGIEWEVSKNLRVAARLPESRAIWFINNRWEASAGFDWNNTTFSLREKGPYDRNKLTIEDYRLFFGAGYMMSDRIKLTCDLSKVFNRSIEFDKNDDSPYESEMDVNDAVALTFGLSSQF